AIATALVPSALGVIRCSGAGCLGLLEGLFSRPELVAAAPGNTIHHGFICDLKGVRLDEVMIAVFRAPHSYTGEEAAEIFCHGSPAGIRLILDALMERGFRAAEPGEFTRRAFLNGKMDLTRAEAVNELINAQTSHAHALALDRLTGSVGLEVHSIRDGLVRIMASLAIQLDYPEEDTGPVDVDLASLSSLEARIGALSRSFQRGRIYQEGVRIALAGLTNAGKSSLFNQLLQHDRSIVSDIHGTTRDYVEALVDVAGIPVRLFDTAGLRETTESVEGEGIRRSETVIRAADLVLYVIAADRGVTDEDTRRLNSISETRPVIAVWNKSDLRSDFPGDALAVSAVAGTGIDELNHRIATTLLGEGGQMPGDGRPGLQGSRHGADRSSPVIDSARQFDLLRRAETAVRETRLGLEQGVSVDAVAVDLQDALSAIGEITGEVTSSDILDVMFGSFCVGK
ncbi:MAG: tRNA uridine-5-carboxymethylaminomethyl(34) synthesis GTPase MnmE, partial [Spirochaetales bacterium]